MDTNRGGKVMKGGSVVRVALACAALGVLAGLAPNASAILVRGSGTVFGQPKVLSVAPQRGVTAASLPRSLIFHPSAAVPFLSNGNLDYNGGGVFHSQAPYVIFWDPSSGISSTTSSLIKRYFTDVAHDSGLASNVYGVLRQYYDSHGFADYSQTFSSGTQAFVDTNAFPARDVANCVNTSPDPPTNKCVTDAQVTTELASFITAHGLPNDGPDPTALPANAPEYYVVLPANVNECTDSANCADNIYCAYHSAFPFGSNGVVYSMIPLMGSVIGGGKGCQFDNNSAVQEPNGDQQADISLKYISHEQAESITDPLPPEGWLNNSASDGGEVGDECNIFDPTDASGNPDPLVEGSNANAFAPTLGGSASGGTLFNQLDNGDEYYIQAEWSNGDVGSGGCELRPTTHTLTAAFSATPSGGNALSFNPGGTTSSGFSSETWSFGDGSTNFTVGGPTTVSHSFLPGTYSVKLTVVDVSGNVSSTTQQVTVGEPPSGSFSFGPNGAVEGTTVAYNGTAADPNTGVSTTISWNFGDGTTGAGASTAHVYTSPGTYTVTMTVTDSSGHAASTSQTVSVTRATITGLAVKNKTRKGATVVVSVNAAGGVSGAGKSGTTGGPGSVSLAVKLSKAQRQKLAKRHRLTLTVSVTFRPNVGTAVTQTVKIKFKS